MRSACHAKSSACWNALNHPAARGGTRGPCKKMLKERGGGCSCEGCVQAVGGEGCAGSL